MAAGVSLSLIGAACTTLAPEDLPPTRSARRVVATPTPPDRSHYGPDVCTDHATLMVTTDYVGRQEEVQDCNEPLDCGHASDVELAGYDGEGAVFTVVWRSADPQGDVWSRQYHVGSRTLGAAAAIGGASGEVAISMNWVRRLGFDPTCALSAAGCGGAIWQTVTGGNDVLAWRQFAPNGTFGPLHSMVGFRGSGEVGCRGDEGHYECTRLLAFVRRDDRPGYPDALQTVQLDDGGTIIPSTLQTIVEVAEPERIFQTAVAYSSAEERFLVAWAQSRENGGDWPKTNGAIKHLLLDFSGHLVGSRPRLTGYCEGDPASSVCAVSKSDGARYNGPCACKGFFLAASPKLDTSFDDRYRIHQYGWGARLAEDGSATGADIRLECSVYCPMAPALFEGEQTIGYFTIDGTQYRRIVAGQPLDPVAGVLFEPRLTGTWSFNGQAARSSLVPGEHGQLLREPIVAGLASAHQPEETDARLYLSILQNLPGGCP